MVHHKVSSNLNKQTSYVVNKKIIPYRFKKMYFAHIIKYLKTKVLKMYEMRTKYE